MQPFTKICNSFRSGTDIEEMQRVPFWGPSGCFWNPLERVPGVPSVSLIYNSVTQEIFFYWGRGVVTDLNNSRDIFYFSPGAQRDSEGPGTLWPRAGRPA